MTNYFPVVFAYWYPILFTYCSDCRAPVEGMDLHFALVDKVELDNLGRGQFGREEGTDKRLEGDRNLDLEGGRRDLEVDNLDLVGDMDMPHLNIIIIL